MALVNGTMQCLADLYGTDEDLMGFHEEPEPIINCRNFELLIEDGGKIVCRPHSPESRMPYTLPIDYDPILFHMSSPSNGSCSEIVYNFEAGEKRGVSVVKNIFDDFTAECGAGNKVTEREVYINIFHDIASADDKIDFMT